MSSSSSVGSGSTWDISTPAVRGVFLAKTVRTFCYGFLGVTLPVYLTELGLGAVGVGAAATLSLAASALLTWAIRRPAELYGGRAVLLGLTGLSALGAVILLGWRDPWAVVAAAMLASVAVGTGETGPFLTIEQVVVARDVEAGRRTLALSLYNLLGHVAGGAGALVLALGPSYRLLFLTFLAATAVEALAYARLPGVPSAAPAAGRPPSSSAPLIRRLAALFALDAFAGGFVLQSMVVYFLHARFGLPLERLGLVVLATQLLTGLSLLVAPWSARRFGLLHTMVWSHLVSNVVLVAIAFAPTARAAIGLLLVRHLLSQLDVPTRQAYLMAVVHDHEREAAASTTNLARTVAQAVSPACTGWVMQALALTAPFAIGGVLKIAYDVLLYASFRDVALRPEPVSPRKTST
jgi:MFS family permease